MMKLTQSEIKYLKERIIPSHKELVKRFKRLRNREREVLQHSRACH